MNTNTNSTNIRYIKKSECTIKLTLHSFLRRWTFLKPGIQTF